MNALTVSVGYDDLLAITLPRMTAVFERVCVVTSPHDHATVLVAESRDNVFAHQTDAFTQDGAEFNKGAAIEEGLSLLGRQAWICYLDADILLPQPIAWPELDKESLYLSNRRVCHRIPAAIPDDWSRYPVQRDTRATAGYFQLFHADAVPLGQKPWYPVHWRHAGGCDTEFNAKWPPDRQCYLPFEVLHLGPVQRNWCGKSPSGRAALGRYLTERRRTGATEHEKLPITTET